MSLRSMCIKLQAILQSPQPCKVSCERRGNDMSFNFLLFGSASSGTTTTQRVCVICLACSRQFYVRWKYGTISITFCNISAKKKHVSHSPAPLQVFSPNCVFWIHLDKGFFWGTVKHVNQVHEAWTVVKTIIYNSSCKIITLMCALRPCKPSQTRLRIKPILLKKRRSKRSVICFVIRKTCWRSWCYAISCGCLFFKEHNDLLDFKPICRDVTERIEGYMECT